MSEVTESTHVVKFDDQAMNWSTDSDINQLFLRSVQNYMNDKLKIRGHVFLNEVYDELGIPRTPSGAITGWLLNSTGDGVITFGEMEPDEKGAIMLDFNIDGVIYEQIGKRRS